MSCCLISDNLVVVVVFRAIIVAYLVIRAIIVGRRVALNKIVFVVLVVCVVILS